MKIGAGGCSNSSYDWGNPWHHYMGLKLNATIIPFWSNGGGNEMNIEKIKYIFDNHPDLDLFVYQITEPSRLVMGLTHKFAKNSITDGCSFNGVSYYTFNGHGNEENLKKMLNKNYTIDPFIFDEAMMSPYNQIYKMFHTLMAINQLGVIYGKKIIFFSWFVDLYEIASQSNYIKTLDSMNIIKGSVLEFMQKNKIRPIPNDGHFTSAAHKNIFNNFIYPQLKEKING